MSRHRRRRTVSDHNSRPSTSCSDELKSKAVITSYQENSASVVLIARSINQNCCFMVFQIRIRSRKQFRFKRYNQVKLSVVHCLQCFTSPVFSSSSRKTSLDHIQGQLIQPNSILVDGRYCDLRHSTSMNGLIRMCGKIGSCLRKTVYGVHVQERKETL